MTRKELKLQAKESLKGRWFQIVLVVLLTTLLLSIQNYYSSYYQIRNLEFSFNFPRVINILISGFISTGLCRYLLNFINPFVNEDFSDLFSYGRYFFKLMGLYIALSIITLIGFILFVIPGIIALFTYSQCYYIMAEDPEISITECMKRSRELMNGHKIELFVLQLSFIGWWIVAFFTLGIGSLFC